MSREEYTYLFTGQPADTILQQIIRTFTDAGFAVTRTFDLQQTRVMEMDSHSIWQWTVLLIYEEGSKPVTLEVLGEGNLVRASIQEVSGKLTPKRTIRRIGEVLELLHFLMMESEKVTEEAA